MGHNLALYSVQNETRENYKDYVYKRSSRRPSSVSTRHLAKKGNIPWVA